MKVYIIHSSKCDYQDELYRPIKESSLVKKHDFVFLYDETQSPGSTKKVIQDCDFVIAEVSYPSIGSGIELGWADAFNKPILCVHKKGEKTSQFISILTQKIFQYEDSKELINILETNLKQF